MTLIQAVNKEWLIEDRFVYPNPEITIQSTRKIENIVLLGKGYAENKNGYVYFYVDNDWLENPRVYVGETKRNVNGRHNATHKKKDWLTGFKYPFIGVVNSPNKPWNTDTRRAIESLIISRMDKLGFNIINSSNSTWSDGGHVDETVEKEYVEDIAELVVKYVVCHIGYVAQEKKYRNNVDIVSTLEDISDITNTPKEETYSQKKVVKEKGNERLVKLVDSGALPVGTQLICSRAGLRLEGTITRDTNGTPGIQCENVFYTSPSTAVEKTLKTQGIKSTSNGWREWRLNDGRRLEEL
jgi:hypothetical protein